MGETPDELSRSIAETRQRMTQTVRAIKARANLRRYAEDDATPMGRVTRAVGRALDRVPVDPAAGDVAAEAASSAEAPHDADPQTDPDRTRRNAPLLVLLACAAAGVLAGLATSPDGARGE